MRQEHQNNEERLAKELEELRNFKELYQENDNIIYISSKSQSDLEKQIKELNAHREGLDGRLVQKECTIEVNTLEIKKLNKHITELHQQLEQIAQEKGSTLIEK